MRIHFASNPTFWGKSHYFTKLRSPNWDEIHPEALREPSAPRVGGEAAALGIINEQRMMGKARINRNKGVQWQKETLAE